MMARRAVLQRDASAQWCVLVPKLTFTGTAWGGTRRHGKPASHTRATGAGSPSTSLFQLKSEVLCRLARDKRAMMARLPHDL
jgi:hypothetical protein